MMGLIKAAFGGKGAGKMLMATADEMHLSKEEKVKYGIEYLKAITPFKMIQRMIVFCVMGMWIVIGLSIVICIWLLLEERQKLFMEFAQTNFVWMPSMGVFTLYLMGGVFKPKKE